MAASSFRFDCVPTTFYDLALAAFYIFWSDSGFQPCPESIDITMFFKFCSWLYFQMKGGDSDCRSEI